MALRPARDGASPPAVRTIGRRPRPWPPGQQTRDEGETRFVRLRRQLLTESPKRAGCPPFKPCWQRLSPRWRLPSVDPASPARWKTAIRGAGGGTGGLAVPAVDPARRNGRPLPGHHPSAGRAVGPLGRFTLARNGGSPSACGGWTDRRLGSRCRAAWLAEYHDDLLAQLAKSRPAPVGRLSISPCCTW